MHWYDKWQNFWGRRLSQFIGLTYSSYSIEKIFCCLLLKTSYSLLAIETYKECHKISRETFTVYWKSVKIGKFSPSKVLPFIVFICIWYESLPTFLLMLLLLVVGNTGSIETIRYLQFWYDTFVYDCHIFKICKHHLQV